MSHETSFLAFQYFNSVKSKIGVDLFVRNVFRDSPTFNSPKLL